MRLVRRHVPEAHEGDELAELVEASRSRSRAAVTYLLRNTAAAIVVQSLIAGARQTASAAACKVAG